MTSELKSQIEPDRKHAVFQALVQALHKATNLDSGTIQAQLGRPPKPEMGDYTFPCFVYAKQLKQAPAVVAVQVAEKLRIDPSLNSVVAKVEAAGAFLNIYVQPGALNRSVIQMVLEAGDAFAGSNIGKGKTIVIDYSSPNFAKPFHVGHLMSTILGASLVRIFRSLSYNVIGVNHLGDWGVQCGFQFMAWKRADPLEREKQLSARGLDYLCELYVDINSVAREVSVLEEKLATKEIVNNPEERARIKERIDAIKPEADARDSEARALFKRLEDGDMELKALWERFRRETLDFLQKNYYDRLGVQFESDAGEGFFEPMLKPLLAELKASGVAVESEGALVIPLDDGPPQPRKENPAEKERKPPFILLKSDAATIYGTRDLAAALYRKKNYDFYKNLYVVNVQQSGHFQMLFKALARIGHAWHKDCVHVSFGTMQIKEGDTVMVMTTRGGRMVPLSELLDHMVAKEREIVKEKNPELSVDEVARVAEAMGVGAIIFWIQSRRRTSNIVFEWEKATDPSGDTGPYLQYSHARTCGILRKSQSNPEIWNKADLGLLTAAEEAAISKVIEQFPKVVRQAAEDYEPSLIATFLLDLASAFGNFLNKHRVLDSEPALRDARLALVDTVRRVMARGLGLLGVAAPEKM